MWQFREKLLKFANKSHFLNTWCFSNPRSHKNLIIYVVWVIRARKKEINESVRPPHEKGNLIHLSAEGKKEQRNKSDAIYYAPAGCYPAVRDKFNTGTAVIFFSALCAPAVRKKEQMMPPSSWRKAEERESDINTLIFIPLVRNLGHGAD